MSIPVISSRTTGQVVLVRVMSTNGLYLLYLIFPRSIFLPRLQCRRCLSNYMSTLVHTSFCCHSNFIIPIVTRSLRMRGRRAFRSSSVYAVGIIGPYSRVYGSFSCSCKCADAAFALFLIINAHSNIAVSLRRASIAIPAGLHGPILHSLKQKMTTDDAIRETRFISFVIAIGILMLFFGPHVVWKFMGQKRATELVKRWESEDARLHAPGTFIPVWTVRLAGYLSPDSVRRSTLLCPHALTRRFYSAPHYYNPIRIRSIILPSSCVSSFGMISLHFFL